MKIDKIDDNQLVIYLQINKIYDIDFKDSNKLEKFLRKLFLRLNDYYNIKIKGYYNVDVYRDKIYGIVLAINKEDLEYYDFLDNQVDMRIILHQVKFLYEVDDIFDIEIKNYYIYKYLNNIYLMPKNKLNKKELAKLLEKSVIVYDSEELIKNSRKLVVYE